ncbi:hypothetical protein Pint_20592 [Pistacia integerrima]|uniref:Uncharacterized protein n=1 Tax=Pistacia integerrima TaxID=434235 RepID=A0ACC0XAE3_9ROSI|nr:hypothetical protein Pint_20592 [Pistacia integerrima]
MAKLSAICFLLLVLIVFTGAYRPFQFIEQVFNGDFKFADELLVPVAEAKDCNKVWNCKGDKRCWDDCKNRYNGKGLCDLYTAPGVPKQCFCAYKC